MPDEPTDEELLRRARDLQQQADRAQADGHEESRSAAERIGDSPGVTKLRSRFAAIMSVLGPIGSFLGWVAGLLVKWFRWAAFRPVENGGTPGETEFSWKRFVLRSFLTLTVPILLHILLSAIYYYATYFEETVYVTGKQEVETGELYQFGGCTSLPCSTESDNGKFYLIESSLYFPIMYYPEENVFANIPQQNGACRVEGYGIYFRTLRWLYKSAQLYQHVVDVSCRPYTEEEIRRAVGGGQIVQDP